MYMMENFIDSSRFTKGFCLFRAQRAELCMIICYRFYIKQFQNLN